MEIVADKRRIIADVVAHVPLASRQILFLSIFKLARCDIVHPEYLDIEE